MTRIRNICEALGAKAHLTIWWAGAAADRLLDEHHAALVERAVDVLHRRGWATIVEASFSEYGERGSIDILGAKAAGHAIAVCEVKSDFGSLEETNRVLDAKERLIPKIAAQRFGFRPAVVGTILIVPSTDRIRRIVARYERTMASTYPARSREVRAWLHRPIAHLRGVWFLSEVAAGDPVDASRI
jgi:Holliday junction resolvase-like predicted endonuclease